MGKVPTKRLVYITVALASIVAFAIFAARFQKKEIGIWIGDYAFGEHEAVPADGIVDIMLMVADHYEPGGNQETLDYFVDGYRELASRHRDSDGRPPRHSWFYPLEQIDGAEVDSLVRLCAEGFGDVEVHLHHFDDTEETLRTKLVAGLDSLRSHGALVSGDSNSHFGFVHGNWALDNSITLSDGRQACGVDNEISILQELGCYGDFTFPALFWSAQPSWTNAIGFVVDDPLQSKSYERHDRARVGRVSRENEFMIVQGPLYINWTDWRFGFHPTIDDGAITLELEPSPERAEHWLNYSAYVQGMESWRFIKLYTHCGDPGDARAFVGEKMDSTLAFLENKCGDGERFRLHYVSAREVYNIIRAAENGLKGNPNDYRDYVIPPYSYPVVPSIGVEQTKRIENLEVAEASDSD